MFLSRSRVQLAPVQMVNYFWIFSSTLVRFWKRTAFFFTSKRSLYRFVFPEFSCCRIFNIKIVCADWLLRHWPLSTESNQEVAVETLTWWLHSSDVVNSLWWCGSWIGIAQWTFFSLSNIRKLVIELNPIWFEV